MTPVACQPGLDIIRDDPEKDFGVLNLPGKSYGEGNFYMLQQVCHGRPITQGNTSRNLVESLRDHLETFDLQVQRKQLANAKVKYIVITHKVLQWSFKWNLEDGYLDQYPLNYPIVYDDFGLLILKVY